MPELAPGRARNGIDVYDLDIREGLAEILPGFQTPIYGYDGIYPGPTIRARKGRAAIVRRRNGLTFDSNVHLHGGYVPAKSDGHPMDVIAPGGAFDYAYPNDQDAAPLWYHDHAHGRTARTLYYGLVGSYVLDDDREEELDLPRGEYDVPIVLADHAFNRDGSLRYAENVDVGFLGDTILVNGAVAPRMRVERRIYRLRFLNASNARIYDLRLGRGRAMVQIASDGGLLERPLRRTEVPICTRPSGSSCSIDFREFRPARRSCCRTRAARRARRAVMRFDVDRGGGAEEARIPRGRMRDGSSAARAQREPALDLALHEHARPCSGRSPAAGSTRRGSTSGRGSGRRSCGSGTTRPTACHPMHLHGMLFRIVERSTGVVPPRRARLEGHGRRAPGRDASTVQPWFGPYAGRYVFHCHNLEHGDKAMMLQLEVVA